MQHELRCGGEARTSGGLQAAASPGLQASGGARAAKRERRVCARGRSSSHATMRSILMAAAVATCCKWVFAKPQYRVRRRPKARTPWESVPSTPARRGYCRWPSSLAYQAWPACRASYCGRGWNLIVRACGGFACVQQHALRTRPTVLRAEAHLDKGMVRGTDALRPAY